MLKVACGKTKTMNKPQKTNKFFNIKKSCDSFVFIDYFETSHIITRLFITVFFN